MLIFIAAPFPMFCLAHFGTNDSLIHLLQTIGSGAVVSLREIGWLVRQKLISNITYGLYATSSGFRIIQLFDYGCFPIVLLCLF
jgi:hypothetical protein